MSLFYHNEKNLDELQVYMKEELDKMEVLLKGVGDSGDKVVIDNLLTSLQDTRIFFRISLKFLEKKIRREDEGD